MNILHQIRSWACSSAAYRARSISSRPARRSLPSLEILEQREVPAGNVTGVAQNGNLYLTGDGADNSIEIRKGVSNIRILGLSGTSINGAGGLEDFSGVFKDVIINLKGGDDLLNLEGGGGGTAAVVYRDLIFRGGGGADTLTSVAGAVVGRDLVFLGAGDTSSATLDGIDIGRHARFSGSANVVVQASNFTKINGALVVQSSALADVTLDDTTLGRLNLAADGQVNADLTDVLVGGNARIKGGLGADVIDMGFGNEILGSLTIQTRGGDDTVEPNAEVGGNVTVHLGGGTNQVFETFSMTVYGNLTIRSSGSGVDNWTLDGVQILGGTSLSTGAGADIVLFDDCDFFGRLNFLGSGGGDQVQISDGANVFFYGPALFDLGNGADTLQLGAGGIGEADFNSGVTLQGGAGADTLNDLNSDFDEEPVILSF